MKGYYELKYMCEITVLVRWSKDLWIDGCRGMNVGHAMHLARLNWDGADVQLVRVGSCKD